MIFDLAFLNVEHRIRDFALGENDLILAIIRYRFPGPYLGEKGFRIEPVLFAAFPIIPNPGSRDSGQRIPESASV